MPPAFFRFFPGIYQFPREKLEKRGDFMKKFWVLSLCFLLWGCARVEPRPAQPVVREITVTEVTADPPAVQHFASDQQTTAVLNYLRLLDIRGPAPVNPEQVAGPMYEIRILYSDGSVSTTRQKADRYILLDDRWQQIEPYSGSRLERILEE